MSVKLRLWCLVASCIASLPVTLWAKQCPDGFSSCPDDYECKSDPSPIGSGTVTQCVPRDARRCDFGEGRVVYCRSNEVCNLQAARCGTAAEVIRSGDFLCPDGLHTCPKGMECKADLDPGGKLSTQCIKPEYSKRCDFGGGFVYYCRPDEVCDAPNRKCSKAVTPPPGNRLCPDGLFYCPIGTECKTDPDPSGRMSTQCIKPEYSRRCDYGGGRVGYCRPDEICDLQSLTCSKPPSGTHICADGTFYCSVGQECRTDRDPGGRMSTQCVDPKQSKRCDFGGGYVYYCRPDEVCDAPNRKCSKAVTPPPGNLLCADGLFYCPIGTECKTDPDPSGRMSTQCIKPEYSKRCDFGGGYVYYCGPNDTCDAENRRCAPPRPSVANLPNLNGSWTAYWGDGREIGPAAVDQQGDALIFYDLCCGKPSKSDPHNLSTGAFDGSDKVVAGGWSVTGQVKSGGKRIDWSNGTYWSR